MSIPIKRVGELPLKFFFESFVLTILLVLGNVGYKKALYLYLFLQILFSLISNLRESVAWSFFLIPFIRVLDVTGITFLVNFLMVVPVMKFAIRAVKNESITKATVFAFILFLLEFIHILFLHNWSNFGSTFSWFLGFVIIFNTSLLPNEEKPSKEELYDAFSLGIIFSAIAFLITQNLLSVSSITNYISSGNRFRAFANDPNYFSLYIVLCLATWLNLKNINKYRIISFYFLIAIILLTGSKMGLILTIIILSVYIYGFFFNKIVKKRTKRIFSLIIITLIGFGVKFKNIILLFWDNYFKRIGGADATIASLTTGRSNIQLNYLSIIAHHPHISIIGYGFQYYLYLGEPSVRIAHNTYLDLILSWGIIGTIVFLLIMYKWYFDYCRANRIYRIRFTELLPIIIFLISCFSLSILSANAFPFILLFIILPLGNSLEVKN